MYLPLELLLLILSYTDTFTIMKIAPFLPPEELYDYLITPKFVVKGDDILFISPTGKLYVYNQEYQLREIKVGVPVRDVTKSGFILDIYGNIWKEGRFITTDAYWINEYKSQLFIIDFNGRMYRSNKKCVKMIDKFILHEDDTVSTLYDTELPLYEDPVLGRIGHYKDIAPNEWGNTFLLKSDRVSIGYTIPLDIQTIIFPRKIKSIFYHKNLYIVDIENTLWRQKTPRISLNLNKHYNQPNLKAILELEKTYMITDTQFIIQDKDRIIFEYQFPY